MKTYPFSPVLGANLCLSDIKRVNAFEKAIKETIKEGDIVIDVGTGTGILALIAVKYGARKVYAVEVDQYLSERVKENAKVNKAYPKIKVINKNIFNIDSISEPVDVVLMEMLTTGLIEEAQIPAYNHLINKRIIGSSTRIIPSAYETSAVPLEYNFEEYGFYMARAKHTSQKDLIRKLAGKRIVSTVDFDGTLKNPQVQKSIEYIITQKGVFNAIGLTSVARLSEGVFLDESAWVNNSVVIPIDKRAVDVKPGYKIRGNISYVMGNGFSTFYAEATC